MEHFLCDCCEGVYFLNGYRAVCPACGRIHTLHSIDNDTKNVIIALKSQLESLQSQLTTAQEENKVLRDGMYSFIILYDTAYNEYHDMVTLERCLQPDDSSKWKIKRRGYCLGKEGEWELEPIPSSRTDEFYSRCRWGSFDEALEFWRQSTLNGGKNVS